MDTTIKNGIEARWIELEGAVNVRDLGGLPTEDGATTRFGRIFRADNLQDLTTADVAYLTGHLGLTDVVDLRSRAELSLEGPGPLQARPDVAVHHYAMLAEATHSTFGAEAVLPWARQDADEPQPELAPGEFYLATLQQRPHAVLSALRVLGSGRGPALVHCAAGKDRTGVLVALALTAVGVPREAIVDDYALSTTRIERIVARLRNTQTYAADLEGRPLSSHYSLPETMHAFLDLAQARFGGLMRWLDAHGWTPGDTRAIREKLLT
jgi:protein-tyrosine phosphatase